MRRSELRRNAAEGEAGLSKRSESLILFSLDDPSNALTTFLEFVLIELQRNA
jgi:hypothetical protein